MEKSCTRSRQLKCPLCSRRCLGTAPLLLSLYGQPAIEELLSLYEDGVVNPEQQKTLVVAVRDCEDGMEADLETIVAKRLQSVWAAAVKPEVMRLMISL